MYGPALDPSLGDYPEMKKKNMDGFKKKQKGKPNGVFFSEFGISRLNLMTLKKIIENYCPDIYLIFL